MSYAILWQFDVPSENHARFEAGYGPGGDWATLFRQGEGFIETILLKDEDRPGTYLTIDRWESRASFDAFKLGHGADYAALDAFLEGLASAEIRIGAYHEAEA